MRLKTRPRTEFPPFSPTRPGVERWHDCRRSNLRDRRGRDSALRDQYQCAGSQPGHGRADSDDRRPGRVADRRVAMGGAVAPPRPRGRRRGRAARSTRAAALLSAAAGSGLALEVSRLLGLFVGALAGPVALLLLLALLLLVFALAAQRGVVGEVAGGLLGPTGELVENAHVRPSFHRFRLDSTGTLAARCETELGRRSRFPLLPCRSRVCLRDAREVPFPPCAVFASRGRWISLVAQKGAHNTCPSPISAFPRTSCARFRSAASTNRSPYRRWSSATRSPAMTCSSSRRPAPARRSPSACRSPTGSSRAQSTSPPSSSPPPASWRARSSTSSRPSPRRGGCASPPSTAAMRSLSLIHI